MAGTHRVGARQGLRSKPDVDARIKAVAPAVGICRLFTRHVVDPVVIARKYNLPPLKSVRVGIFVRPGIDYG
jgi:hypothetical protein